ncbi:MAG: ABC transporter ATP-binding protein [Acidimicrobiia bacterium]|nr:ABC transporter ATP-binding protein [Acidimicrobiia bacterium]MYG72949.1 ABC transporter ATP-binding protein [Acidimicrobiia bacterium]
MRSSAIEVTGLRKAYGAHEAVAGVDLHVEEGEILAFLGPNGAGKTTTVEILEGFRTRTAGEVSVLGQDPASAGLDWRERIGIVLQESQPEEYLTVAETVIMWAAYFPAPRPVAEVLELVGLADHRDQRVGRLSGGQRRRLDLALALVGNPELLFLDEPTTGFDPTARREAWAMIDGLRDLGVTVLLTTHYMDEAQNLADRISVIAAGQIIAKGTAADLAEAASLQTRISWNAQEVPLDELPDQLRAAATVFDLAGQPGDSSTSAAEGPARLAIFTNEVTDTVAALLQVAGRLGHKVESLEVQTPTLEDTYLALIGEADRAGGLNR